VASTTSSNFCAINSLAAARSLIAAAKRPVALLSSWGSNEELAAFRTALGARFASHLKTDWAPEPGEPVEDNLLIRRDKNPNTAGVRALFPPAVDTEPELGPETDLVLVWGEGFDFARLHAKTKIVFLNSYLQPENGHADVFIPISNQTERRGHYTNFQGVTSAFEPCFPKLPSVADAQTLFAALGASAEVAA